MKMKILVDIDNTICESTSGNYHDSVPMKSRIEYMNQLFDYGHEIHYWTARGGTTGKDWSELTTKQFEEWGVKYTSLNFRKPSYDIWIDDKAFNADDYFGPEL